MTTNHNIKRDRVIATRFSFNTQSYRGVLLSTRYGRFGLFYFFLGGGGLEVQKIGEKLHDLSRQKKLHAIKLQR